MARPPDREHGVPPLEVIHQGIVDYPACLQWQRKLVDQRSRMEIPDTLLLVEHPHVITRGRGFRSHSIGETIHPIHESERGGDATYHGPGQLVGYPIISLKERNLSVGRYLRLLEEILIQSLAPFGVKGYREKGFSGVWVEGKKVASLGIAVRSWVSYHGFALNVSTDLSQFSGIFPCGLEPEQMTSLKKLLGWAPSMEKVRQEVEKAFLSQLAAPPLEGDTRSGQKNKGIPIHLD